MGRHCMPAPGRHRLAVRHAPVRRLRAPALAAVLLAAAPAGPALAAPDQPPPAALDGVATALGGALGTSSGSGSESESDGEPVAPAGAADLIDVAGLGDATPLAGPADSVTEVTLLEKNDSGVSGSAEVDAERVVATASGMDPQARYVSFFYGATSSATNNNPCILDGTNPFPGDQTVGEWDVDADGNGTLSAANPLGARYALQAGTMSVRKVEHDFSAASALPVNPLSYSLVACGEVQRLEVLDPVTELVPKLPKFPSLRPLS